MLKIMTMLMIMIMTTMILQTPVKLGEKEETENLLYGGGHCR